MFNRQNGEQIKDQQSYEDLLKQKNELFKLSEDLYEELKKCMEEKDEYLK